LHPWVEAQDGGDDRHPQVVAQRTLDVGPDDVGAPQGGHAYVWTASREAAYVALDLVDVLGVARARDRLGAHVLGEHRRVAAAGAVDRGRRLHDQVLDGLDALAGSEELHRADDVEFLHGVASAGLAGGRDHAHVDDGVDLFAGYDLRDDGVADVGADEGDLADVAAGRNDVHPDDTVNGGVGCGVARETAPDVPGDPGDQHDPPHGREVLLAELATLHA